MRQFLRHGSFVLSALAAACGDDTGPGGETRAVEVHIGATALRLEIGDTLTQNVVIKDGEATYEYPARSYPWPTGMVAEWSSSDPTVATVDYRGLLTAVSAGRATITVRVGRGSDTATVAVSRSLTPSAGFVSVSAGASHSCALKPDGRIACWGSSWFGELGLGSKRTYTAVVSPVMLSSAVAMVAIDAGSLHSCALDSKGVAWCWGSNQIGQLGTVRTPESVSPTAVSGGIRFRMVSAGGDLTCGIALTGESYCWGKVGEALSNTPARVPGGHRFAVITAGGTHACGLTSAGEAWCWGRNESGQVGSGNMSAAADAPVPVAGSHVFSEISAGYVHSCGLTPAGAVYCWGQGDRLGDGTLASSAVPRRVAGDRTYRTISAGGQHSCALTTTGEAYCWGRNLRGQVGDGFNSADPTITIDDLIVEEPRAVAADGEQFVFISAGEGEHSCALAVSGETWCWGLNRAGQLGAGVRRLSPGTELLFSTRPQRVLAVFSM